MDVLTYGNKTKCRDCQIKSKAVSTLTQPELDILERSCLEVSLKKGEKVLVEGMPPSHIVYLREGYAKIHMKGSGQRDQILKIARPGAYIGLQTILGDRLNHYSATTIQDSQACFIDIDVFKDLIKKNGIFAYEIVVYICQEELNYYHRFVDQGQKQINGRLAGALLYFSEEVFKSQNFTLPLTKNDIAALTGTSRESVTRSLKNFKDDEIIVAEGKNVTILDLERLRRISDRG